MPQRGLSFASGFAQGMASVTDLWLRQRIARQQMTDEDALQRERQQMAFENARTLQSEDDQRRLQAAQEERTARYLEQYGMVPGAMQELPPGAQGPTPATGEALAGQIRRAPAFQHAQAVQRMESDEAIRVVRAREAAEGAAENVMSVADRLRLGSDIARVYSDAYDAAEMALDPYADGSQAILANYGGDRVRAIREIASGYAKPALDQIMALVPPEIRAGLSDPGANAHLGPTQSERIAQFEAELARETDPAKIRAKYSAFKTVLQDMGQALSPEQEALYEARLTKLELAAAPAGRSSPLLSAASTYLTSLTNPAQFARTVGRGLRAARPAAAAAAPDTARRPVASSGAESAYRTAAGRANQRANQRANAPLPAPADPRRNVKTINPVQMRLEALVSEETRLLEQARQDLAMGGVVRSGVETRLRQVQAEITRFGGQPQSLASPSVVGN